MEAISIVVLSDLLRALVGDIEEGMEFFLDEPFQYPQPVIDEMLDILDRLQCLEIKLSDIDFKGDYRY